MSISHRLRLGLTFLFGLPGICVAQIGGLSAEEVEQRGAAAGFVFARALSLEVLRVECGYLMPSAGLETEAIARAWHGRNSPDIEAATVWADKYLTHLKATDPQKYQTESLAITASLGRGLLAAMRSAFRRQPPDPSSCAFVLRQYSTPVLDFQRMASNPGFERFKEFPATLSRIREDFDYLVPGHLNIRFRERADYKAAASIDAAEAAHERGDGPAQRAIYKRLAAYGDSRAAQSLALIFQRGDLVARDAKQAYQWFYSAWVLKNSDGLNGIGVSLRDGTVSDANKSLAYAAFLFAGTFAKERRTADFSMRAASALSGEIFIGERKRLACMTVEAFDAEVRVHAGENFAIGKPILQGNSRLGEIILELKPFLELHGCTTSGIDAADQSPDRR